MSVEEDIIYINPNCNEPIYYYTSERTIKIILANEPIESQQQEQQNENTEPENTQNENLENP